MLNLVGVQLTASMMLVWSNEAQDGVLVAEVVGVETLKETHTTRSSSRRRERELECNFMLMFIPVVDYHSLKLNSAEKFNNLDKAKARRPKLAWFTGAGPLN